MQTHVMVAYGSKYGATTGIAERIGAVLEGSGLNVTVMPADHVNTLTPFQAVVLGSAVYAGHWLKEPAHVLTTHKDELAVRPVWLFSSGPIGQGDPVTLLGGWRFPETLQSTVDYIHPRDMALFHGAIDPAKLHLGDRLIVKAMNVQTGDCRDWGVIRAWAEQIANALWQQEQQSSVDAVHSANAPLTT